MQEISIRHGSRMANRVLQLLAAKGLLQRAGSDGVITGHDIPEWHLSGRKSSPGFRQWPKLDVQRFDVPWLLERIASGDIDRLRINAVVADMEVMPDRQIASALIDARGAAFHATGPDEVVIHVRLEDVMTPGRHAGYGPLPLAWYEEILTETGLTPVFVGQLADDPYSEALRARFPGATVLEGGSVLHDFQTIRNAHNVILGVSTFSWLAAWLGARERVFYPMLGVMNPAQAPQVNLMPLGDPRYHFHRFPLRDWTASPAAIAALIDGPSPAEAIDRAEVEAVVAAARAATAGETDAWRDRVRAAIAR